jgi:predicted metallopeptidase
MAKLLYFSDEIFIVEISYMIQLLRKGIFLRANCLNKIKVFVGEILATQFSFLN